MNWDNEKQHHLLPTITSSCPFNEFNRASKTYNVTDPSSDIYFNNSLGDRHISSAESDCMGFGRGACTALYGITKITPPSNDQIEWGNFLMGSKNCDRVDTNIERLITGNIYSDTDVKAIGNVTILKLDSNKIVDTFGVLTSNTLLENERRLTGECSPIHKPSGPRSVRSHRSDASEARSVNKRKAAVLVEEQEVSLVPQTKSGPTRKMCQTTGCSKFSQGDILIHSHLLSSADLSVLTTTTQAAPCSASRMEGADGARRRDAPKVRKFATTSDCLTN